MVETRTRIAEAVRTQPGIHFNGLVRSLDLATGQVQYHL
ncbi:MAG: winged helix-turn-helix transcriptional regulator, partial [Halobacteriota archaeon]